MARRDYSEMVDSLSNIVCSRAFMTKEEATYILNQFEDDGLHWWRVDEIVSMSLLGLLPDVIVDAIQKGVPSAVIQAAMVHVELGDIGEWPTLKPVE